MRPGASQGAHSRDVLALDVEAVGLCVRHDDRFLASGLCVGRVSVVLSLWLVWPSTMRPVEIQRRCQLA